jgi:hypothetical protein
MTRLKCKFFIYFFIGWVCSLEYGMIYFSNFSFFFFFFENYVVLPIK